VFYALDDEFRFIHANERATALLSRSVEELLGKTIWELFPESRETRGYTELHRALESQEPRAYVETFPTLEKRFEVRVYPSATGMSVYFQGVTERTARAEAIGRANDRLERSNARPEASNERVERFAYAASHDLQEPLRMVSSYLRLLEDRYDDRLDDDGEEFLGYAIDGADRMREMIEALLAYSRVETRGQPFEPVELEALLDDVRSELDTRLTESDAQLSVTALPQVAGDGAQLRQLFEHVLDNAIEYSGEDRPRIDLSADRDGELRIVSVCDRGIGIPERQTEAIFEVFKRLHTVEAHAGTGIGLALCQRIAERHGGDIWVESEFGEGSTFFVALPAAGSDRESEF
jgi:PAS domain S-box-containing protein